MRSSDRYEAFAPFYDIFAGEAVYRPGRLRGIDSLRLRPGQTVVDAGCGTGLNFRHLQEILGPGGTIIGVDSSPAMLRQAWKRTRRHGWSNVRLVHADLTAVTPGELGHLVHAHSPEVDAVLASYSLSVTADPEAAWQALKGVCGAGTKVCVVDMQLPRGKARFLAPLAALACRLGGSHPDARPWRLLERDAVHVTSASLRGGHLQIRTGVLRAG